MAPRTIRASLTTAQRFLASLRISDLSAVQQLASGDVSGFVLRQARSLSVGSAGLIVSQVRSFLRFLHVRGVCSELRAAAPTVPRYQHARLPRHIPPEEVEQLIESCDRQTAVGLRDRAVLLMCARLGLRACEVAALNLDDIHWRRGEILIRGKGSRQAMLPLPQEVGEAMSCYLRDGRPTTTSRRLFLKSRAPHDDINPENVRALVQTASRRVDLYPRSAHQLRHTAATQMLRRGASLPEVGEVLRHQSLDATAIYAKVDHLALRSLARPWPGGER